MSTPVLFLSYAHADAEWKNRLLKHLCSLERQALLTVWEDDRISGGDDWRRGITAAMDAASLAIFLVSPAFLGSKFIQKTEVPHLFARWERRADGLRIYPILAELCDWESAPLLRCFQIRPSSVKGVTPLSVGTPHEQEEKLAAIAKEIRLLLTGIRPAEVEKGPRLRPNDVSIAKLPQTGDHFLGRNDELTLLDGAWADDNTKVLSIVAWGGTGKSALVNEWLSRMARDHWRGAVRVFAWTFYSQGTRDTAASADQFIDAALRWFGDPDPATGSAWDKGERLARLVRRQRTLLLLDGLEPLQQPPHAAEPGRITDPALSTLVRELALENPGLCVITTREPVADLAGARRATTAQLDLAHLSTDAGAALLRELGVRGADGELRQIAQDVRGHALTLSLMGNYLAQAHGGDIRQRSEVKLLAADVEVQGSHAFRVMEAYERWLVPKGILAMLGLLFSKKKREARREGKLLVAILRLLGLFDRPADGGCLAALRKKPAIPDLTEPLVDLTNAQWNIAVSRLASCGLVSAPAADPSLAARPSSLDAHPLVREHFGEQLRTRFPAAWQEGHNRLYEHLKQAAPNRPDTLEEMMPLFAAVAHGCQAGKHQETYDDVYRRRICRGNEHYQIKKLGAFGADLATISGFFKRIWDQTANIQPEGGQAWLLNTAGFHLRALGRLTEAVQPMRAGLDMCIAYKAWEQAAEVAGNLSELSLTLGAVAEANRYARQSLALHDRSGGTAMRMFWCASLADALHQAGRLDWAEVLFRNAEAVQKAMDSNYPQLFSLRGHLYCDLLLTRAGFGLWLCLESRLQAGSGSAKAGTRKAAPAIQLPTLNRQLSLDLCRSVQKRAAETLEQFKKSYPLLDIALDHLSLGRAVLLDHILTSAHRPLNSVSKHLNAAVDGLRQAGTQDHLPRGLLARAALGRVSGDLSGAAHDLAEAQELADRSGMRLFQVDGLIEEACQLIQRSETLGKVRECVAKAKEIINETGYHRRDPEVQYLEEILEE